MKPLHPCLIACLMMLGVGLASAEPKRVDDDTLYRTLKPQADAGDSDAQLAIGSLYENGKGVPQNHEQATFWYRKAAEAGNDKAQFHLGNSYLEGRGVAKDPMQAVSWYEKAAAQNNAEALFNLGTIYVMGTGGGTDEPRGAAYWEKAAALKHPQATMNLAVYYFQGSRTRAPDYTQAQKWLKQSLPFKHAMVDFMLGLSYWKGLGVKQDYQAAERHFQHAISKSHPLAARKLAEMQQEQETAASP
jgi:uncharacterized protein